MTQLPSRQEAPTTDNEPGVTLPPPTASSAAADGLASNTKIWTEHGLRDLEQLAESRFQVMLHGPSGTFFTSATVEAVEAQPTVAVTIGRKVTKTFATSADQSWLVRGRASEDRTDSTSVPAEALSPGQRLLTVRPRSRLGKARPSPFGVAAGIVFGDGCRPRGRDATVVTLHGNKRQLVGYFAGCPTTYNLDGSINIFGLPGSFKEKVSLTEGSSTLFGWLAGYVATDGSVSGARGQVTLSSADWNNLDFARTVATRLGITAGDITTRSRVGLGRSEATDIFSVRLLHPPLALLLRDDHRRRWREPAGSVPSWTVRALKPLPASPLWQVAPSRPGNLVLDGYVVVPTGSRVTSVASADLTGTSCSARDAHAEGRSL